jgi:hypothetical protein
MNGASTQWRSRRTYATKTIDGLKLLIFISQK